MRTSTAFCKCKQNVTYRLLQGVHGPMRGPNCVSRGPLLLVVRARIGSKVEEIATPSVTSRAECCRQGVKAEMQSDQIPRSYTRKRKTNIKTMKNPKINSPVFKREAL